MSVNRVSVNRGGPTFLWSEYGIRSLSRNSVYYQKDNPGRAYWRGAIWINLNYLTLRSLHHYSHIPGPYQSRASSIYQRLRHSLISDMYREYVVRVIFGNNTTIEQVKEIFHI